MKGTPAGRPAEEKSSHGLKPPASRIDSPHACFPLLHDRVHDHLLGMADHRLVLHENFIAVMRIGGVGSNAQAIAAAGHIGDLFNGKLGLYTTSRRLMATSVPAVIVTSR